MVWPVGMIRMHNGVSVHDGMDGTHGGHDGNDDGMVHMYDGIIVGGSDMDTAVTVDSSHARP